MKKILTPFILLAGMIASMTSCSLFVKEDDSIGGKAGEVIVVTTKSIWDSEAGQILSDSLMQECKYLPQREPMYNLVYAPEENFTSMFKIHRNIIRISIDKSDVEGSLSIANNVWAKRQIVFEIKGKDVETIRDVIKKNVRYIMNTLGEKERMRVISNTRKYQERVLADSVKAFIGGELVFPAGFTMKKRSPNFMWISHETRYVQQGFIIYKTPASHSAGEMTAESLTGLMNRVLRIQVPGSMQNSYMTVSSQLTPGYRHVMYRGREFEEIKGLWELRNDFMGGPFAAHCFYSQDEQWIITIFAYVYAPKYDKRLYIRQVESLLYSY